MEVNRIRTPREFQQEEQSHDWDRYKEETIMAQKKLKVIATIHSFSEIEKKYTLKQDDVGHLTCNCPAWIFNQSGNRTCKHTDVLTNHSDNLETLIAYSGQYKVEIENDGTRWIIEKKHEPNL